MKQDVNVPSVGESITSGVIVAWLKNTGDYVNEGDNLFELETDKAVLEIPSPAAGTLEVLVDEGTEVQIGQTVAALDTEAEAKTPAQESSTNPQAQPEEIKATPAPEKKEAEPPQTPKSQPTPSKPIRIQAAASPASSPKSPMKTSSERHTERVPMSAIRRKTAERLVKAKQTAAYLTTFNDIDMDKVMSIRKQYKADFEKEHGIKIGFMSFFVKACCQALKEFPGINAMVDGQDILYNHFYDIGVAMSIDRGLVVPILRDADKLHFAEIEAAISDLAQRARDKQLKPDELMGGTFTITNGGIFGSLMSTPIPAYPQSAILGMHAIKKRPVVVDDQIVIRPMMYIALSYDHRVIDGRDAVSFLVRIKEYIEAPDKLLLEL